MEGEGNPLDLEPPTMRFVTGARHRPAPVGTPVLRAGLSPDALKVPTTCDRLGRLDLSGAGGQPDALGNLTKPNCVVAGALRMMQLWANDGRKPTEAQADAIFPAWGGTAAGIWTDEAFDHWGRSGIRWDDQQIITSTRVLVEADGIAPDLRLVRAATWHLGAVGFVFRMPATAFTYDRWMPGPPSAGGLHDVHFAPVFDFVGLHTFIGYSWGRFVEIDPTFIIAHTLQANAFVSSACVHPDGHGGARTPSGLTLEELHSLAPALAGV